MEEQQEFPNLSLFNFIMNSVLIDLWIPKIIKYFVLFIDVCTLYGPDVAVVLLPTRPPATTLTTIKHDRKYRHVSVKHL